MTAARPPGTPDGPRPAEPGPPADPVPRRRIESQALFQGCRELVIVHNGKEYVLRITRQGKLILTA